MRANIIRGIAAGFCATLVLTAIMVVKAATGVMADVNLAALMSGVLHAPIYVGWAVHFVVGTLVWGALFAWLAPKIPASTCVVKGIFFAAGAWMLMQLVVLPLAGMGPFGARYGLGAPVLTFVLHMIYGVTLGVLYAQFKGVWHVKGPGSDAHGALRYTHY